MSGEREALARIIYSHTPGLSLRGDAYDTVNAILAAGWVSPDEAHWLREQAARGLAYRDDARARIARIEALIADPMWYSAGPDEGCVDIPDLRAALTGPTA